MAEFGKNSMEPYIETYSGEKFYFLEPSIDSIKIEDIAHALSNNCRYTGHCSRFYSVAEHSIGVSILTDSLEGLLHDASEAYIADISSPVKPYLHNYKEMEKVIMDAIGKKFGFGELSKLTHYADLQQLSTEAHYLIPSKGDPWPWDKWHHLGRPHILNGEFPAGFSPAEAKSRFLARYEELVRK